MTGAGGAERTPRTGGICTDGAVLSGSRTVVVAVVVMVTVVARAARMGALSGAVRLLTGLGTMLVVIAAILAGARGFEQGQRLRRQARGGAEQQHRHTEKVRQES